MPAHNLLWRECEKSSNNVAARLASIPLVQVLHYFYKAKNDKSIALTFEYYVLRMAQFIPFFGLRLLEIYFIAVLRLYFIFLKKV